MIMIRMMAVKVRINTGLDHHHHHYHHHHYYYPTLSTDAIGGERGFHVSLGRLLMAFTSLPSYHKLNVFSDSGISSWEVRGGGGGGGGREGEVAGEGRRRRRRRRRRR